MSELPSEFLCRGMYQCEFRKYVRNGDSWERQRRFNGDWETDNDGISEEIARYAWDNAVELYVPVERENRTVSDWKDEELSMYGKGIRDAAIALLQEVYGPFLYDDRAVALLEQKSPASVRLREAIGISVEELRGEK